MARLDITVAVRVNDASVTNSNQLPGVPPYGTDFLASQIGQSGYVYVSALAREAQCLPNCVTGADDFAVFQWGTGTASASGQDHIFHLTLSNCSNSSALDFSCSQPENLPAGDISIIGSVGVVANQQDGS